MIETTVSIFLQIGRSIMTEESSTELYNELLKRNQRNSAAITSFLRTANRRYPRKMNFQIDQPQCRAQLTQPPILLLDKHSPVIRNSEVIQNSFSKLDLSKESQLPQSHNYLCSKQRKQEIKSLLKFVRETRQTKLKFYNVHAKRQDSLLEAKTIARAPLHLKNIIFYGEGHHKLELRRNNSMKCTFNTLPSLKVLKNNMSVHNNTVENA